MSVGDAPSPARFPFAPRIRAVLFDAGNTLLWIDHLRMARIVSPALGRGGADAVTEAEVRAAEMHARPRLDPFLRGAARREGADVARRYAEIVVSGLGADPSSARGAAAATALLGAWRSLWVCPPADASPTLDLLAARGFVVGCVSNSDGTVASLLAAAGLATRLACIVDSGVVGVEKPDPRIFRIAAERLGVAPSACVYVGDFLSLDVEGARGAGMEGVLLDPAGAWESGDAALDGVPRVRSLGEFAEALGRRG
jgi:putative hydrolase of the HAD superfamily